MDLIQHDSMASMALTTLHHDKPVYNSTTIPINNNNNNNSNNNNNNRETILNNKRISNASIEPADATEYKFSTFSNLPKTEPIDLQFTDISYRVKLGFIGNKEKEILHKINGKFPGSQLTAIMGPSGAGKSTLLDVLSGYRRTGVSGTVYINGRTRNLDQFRKMSCYITQDDRLQILLTVLENMRIAADFKLGNSMEYHEKEARIEEILTNLGLYQHQMTLAGRLSGGQRKRLSIALELLNNPTIMFLDEPTTGLDSHSCNKVLTLLRQLASQGRTIICTIHQPSAKHFQEFEQVYVLASGQCMYQGGTGNIISYLQTIEIPCPMYHNPADYVIELACEEHGVDKVELMVNSMNNGESIAWFSDPSKILRLEELRQKCPLSKISKSNGSLEATSPLYQLKILMKRGVIKGKRDTTLTYLRIGVNIILAFMLGFLFIKSGNEASRVVDNYNLLFAILMHHSMTTMMLTVLTFPTEMAILLKEHFNRWYSLKAYYTSVTLLDIPISIVCCLIFTVIIYLMSSQPMEWFRFNMFFVISLLVVFVGQSLGLMVGAWFDVVNGTFLAPTITIPMMMFAGFGVTLRDLPNYLKWGSHISYLRYGLEGYVGAIYGEGRSILTCSAEYCHYKYPKKFLSEISMAGDQFWNDVIALIVTVIFFRILAYILLRWKIVSVR